MNQNESKERGRRAIDDSSRSIQTSHRSRPHGGSVVGSTTAAFLIALIEKVERLEATLTQLLTRLRGASLAMYDDPESADRLPAARPVLTRSLAGCSRRPRAQPRSPSAHR